MKESLRITRQENGFTVRMNVILNDDTEAKLTYVYEEKGEDAHVIDVLYDVLDYFGYRKFNVVPRKEDSSSS